MAIQSVVLYYFTFRFKSGDRRPYPLVPTVRMMHTMRTSVYGLRSPLPSNRLISLPLYYISSLPSPVRSSLYVSIRMEEKTLLSSTSNFDNSCYNSFVVPLCVHASEGFLLRIKLFNSCIGISSGEYSATNASSPRRAYSSAITFLSQ